MYYSNNMNFFIVSTVLLVLYFPTNFVNGQNSQNQSEILICTNQQCYQVGRNDTMDSIKTSYERVVDHTICSYPFSWQDLKAAQIFQKKLEKNREKGFKACYKPKKKKKKWRREVEESPFVKRQAMTKDELDVLISLNLNNINAVAQQIFCETRGTLTPRNTHTLCHMCQYLITLPASFVPQFLIHYTCGDNGDDQCFQGEGVCAKTVFLQSIAILDANLMIQSTVDIPITTGCSCEIIKGNMFVNFI